MASLVLTFVLGLAGFLQFSMRFWGEQDVESMILGVMGWVGVLFGDGDMARAGMIAGGRGRW